MLSASPRLVVARVPLRPLLGYLEFLTWPQLLSRRYPLPVGRDIPQSTLMRFHQHIGTEPA
jgi:hypothetical protein